MKTLKDVCLSSIGENLDKLNRPGRYLAPIHKEILIKRLADHNMLTTEYLPNITYNLFSNTLKNIDFYASDQINDQVLKKFKKSQCHLQSITIHSCQEVTDVGIRALTSNQNELQNLILRKLPYLTSDGLTEVQSKVLHKVDLRGCSSIQTNGIRKLLSKNPNVKILVLVDCCKLDDTVFPIIASEAGKNLEELDVAGLHFMSDSSLTLIGESCPKLKKLNISGCNKVTSEAVKVISQKCPALKEVDLSYCSQLSKEPHSQCLTGLPEGLTYLSLCGVYLEDAELVVNAIKRLKELKTVRLCGIPTLSDHVMKEILKEVGANLETLDISYSMMTGVTDDGLKYVNKYCKNLEVLAVTLLKGVTGITLVPFFSDKLRASYIKSLFLSLKQLDSQVLNEVAANCVNLEILDVGGLAIVDDAFLMVLSKNCPKLHNICLKGCRPVTDLGVIELARSCPMKRIVLSGLHNITDKSIFVLANSCPYLEEIYLNGCAKVSPVAVRYLLDCCIPRLYMQHKVPNASPDQLMAKNLDTGEFCRADLM